MTVLAAAFYNFFSSVLGGIEVVVVEEESIGNKLSRCARGAASICVAAVVPGGASWNRTSDLIVISDAL